MTRKQNRIGRVSRATKETEIEVQIDLDGAGSASIETGIGFLDHMLTLFAAHGLFDLTIRAKGDLHIDEHHTAEDTCICLGRAIAQALDDRSGITRTAHSFVPMDEALAHVVIDLGGRPYAVFDAEFSTARLGGLATDLLYHLFECIAIHGAMNIHARVLYGRNDHHKAEGLFKALGRALDEASKYDPRRQGVPSTKGTLIA